MRRLVLVGGGHAHLAVLRDLARRPLGRAHEVVLVSPSERHHYSGMVPGFLRGTYAEHELAVDLRALCRAAGAHLMLASADAVSGHDRVVETPAGRLEFDLASLDVGADPAGLDDVPGAREHAHAARPIARVLALDRALDAAPHAQRRGAVEVCVVGGGAAGIEVALAMHARLTDAGRSAHVTLVERAGALLPDGPPRARRAVERVLGARGITLRAGATVTAVAADAVTLDSGESVPSTVTVWLAGAEPSGVLRRSRVAKDGRGYLLVDRTLRSADGAPVWGAGDCVTLRDFPDTPKAGVYAVRAGPVLAHNLRAAIDGGPMRAFVPRRHVLSILNVGDGRAVGRWRGMSASGRWVWRVKDAIDRRFVARHQDAGAPP